MRRQRERGSTVFEQIIPVMKKELRQIVRGALLITFISVVVSVVRFRKRIVSWKMPLS
jgi:hypothetical protein